MNEHILIVRTEVEGGEIFFVKHLEVVEAKKGHESLCVAKLKLEQNEMQLNKKIIKARNS